MRTNFKGIDGVRGFYQMIVAALPDLRVEVVSEYDVSGCCICEVLISGTHQGESAGVKALENRIRIENAAFYAFDANSGKLVSERIYYDQTTVVQQMRLTQASEFGSTAEPGRNNVRVGDESPS